MTPERFRHLTNAYGANRERWPETERADAEALLAQGDPHVRAALEQARALDRILAMHAVAPPSAALRRQIAASGPTSLSLWSWDRFPWWVSGAGLLSVAVMGIAAGVLTISLAASPQASTTMATTTSPSFFDESDAGTGFDAINNDWSE